jgi:peptidyl-prolyl cis-trans isomerase SurA
VYDLKPESFSTIFITSTGYHIFKNAGERPALGRRKIQQLLFPLPPGFTETDQAAALHTADSVYTILKGGTPFEPVFQCTGTTIIRRGRVQWK